MNWFWYYIMKMTLNESPSDVEQEPRLIGAIGCGCLLIVIACILAFYSYDERNRT